MSNSDNGSSGRYAIFAKETSKDDIEQPIEVEEEVLPPLGASILLCGKSGSGKSTLLASLINDENNRFYKEYFDKVFLFSPTGHGDDIQSHYGIPENHVFTDLDEAPELLELIIKTQRDKIKRSNNAKTAQYAVVFDDIIGDTKFMNSKQFSQCFYMCRHANVTTFICTQHYKRVPRICRQQASLICFFRCSRNEVELIAEEFSPPFCSKRSFMGMIDTATQEPFSFFTINMKCEWEKRFRKNLFPILPIPRDQETYDATQFSNDEVKEVKEKEDSQDGIEKTCSKQTEPQYGKVQKARRRVDGGNNNPKSDNSRRERGGSRPSRGLSYRKTKEAIVRKGK